MSFASIYLTFYLLLLCLSWSSSSVCMLFLRTTKVLMRLNVLSFGRFKSQNVLIAILFSMKHSYLLPAKITPDVGEDPTRNINQRKKSDILHYPETFHLLLYSSFTLK